MVKFETALGGKTLELSVYAENIVRVRVSENFEPTLFERYGIYRKPEEMGEVTENGVKTGKLSVEYRDGKVYFSSDKFTRSIDLDNSKVAEVKAYMNERLNGFHDEHVVIIGSEDEEQLEQKTQEFPALSCKCQQGRNHLHQSVRSGISASPALLSAIHNSCQQESDTCVGAYRQQT